MGWSTWSRSNPKYFRARKLKSHALKPVITTLTNTNVVDRHWRRAAEANPDVAAHHSCRPHLLRHSKATHLVEENVSIYYVRDFLGHSSVETTQVYLKSNVERMRSAIQSAALKTVGNNNDYYTEEKRATLLEFLENLL